MESWLIEAMSHGDYDDFWKNSGSSVVDHLEEYKDVPEFTCRLVRFVGHAGGEPELRQVAKDQEKPPAADRQALDSQP